MLQCGAVWCGALQCVSVLQNLFCLSSRVSICFINLFLCVVVCWNVVQCVVACCSTCICLPSFLFSLSAAVCCSILQYVAVCCSVLQCVAMCCSVLQCFAGKYMQWMSRVRHVNEGCHTCQWVRKSHAAYVNTSYHTGKFIKCVQWISHVTDVKESCEWVLSLSRLLKIDGEARGTLKW